MVRKWQRELNVGTPVRFDLSSHRVTDGLGDERGHKTGDSWRCRGPVV
jgi:hypothetical protein